MSEIATIPPLHLLWLMLPLVVVWLIRQRWQLKQQLFLVATTRMLIQLTAVGYALTYIFNSDRPTVTSLVLITMLSIAAAIATRPFSPRRRQAFPRVLLATTLATVPILGLVAMGVLQIQPLREPSIIIPLAGMTFAGTMNAISLAADRYRSEREQGLDYPAARNHAFEAALIPVTNSCLAVGLVALPGMMTGQILAGADPLVAVRYQIVVMVMLYSAATFGVAGFLAMPPKT
jgi:putative ABC transport system permease protein